MGHAKETVFLVTVRHAPRSGSGGRGGWRWRQSQRFQIEPLRRLET